MHRKTFRILIAGCAIWTALSLPSLVAVTHATIASGNEPAFELSVTTLGFAILPVAVIGLWYEQLWGLMCLLIGFVCVLVVLPIAAHLHVVCLVVTLVRYFCPRHEAST